MTLADLLYERGDSREATFYLRAALGRFRDLELDRYASDAERMASRWGVALEGRSS